MTNGRIHTDWVETVSQDGLHLMQTRLEVRVPTSEGRKFITCGLARKTYVVKDGIACRVSSYALGRDLGSPGNYDFEIVSATGCPPIRRFFNRDGVPAEIPEGALFDAHEGLDDGEYIVRIAAGMTTSWDSGTGQSIELHVPCHELAFVVVGSAPQEVRASTGGPWAARPHVEIPVVDWRDQPTSEAAWEAYLNGSRISLDAYGIFSPQHLMRNQRDTALEILRSEGYAIPRTPEPAGTPGTWRRWGGAWMPADVLAALHTVPDDTAQRAWYQGAKESLDIAWDMHLLWTTDVF
ncbi:hypothetical protein PV367_12900 [Streptomyces europaeiscabiei]|uniref:Uncharacterized protein n=1 Tax=Streptomyces europaeiscabiei TaxID=146819 RepID=A0AAJ2PNC4_9ACTN|nr:hypothetical protein [Streptomyces europaeiscabiei]MDX3130668.1 hypothetical protein [Streptomyces europaeiscabiei]